jgi:hypothetical protein
MQDRRKELESFVTWFKKHIKGYERGEGQLFFNQLLQAFGNPGILEVGAALEERVKKRKGTTGFADFVWKPRVIVELKERGTPLNKHYDQAFEYWMTLVPNRPKYMALCNFDEFWIYDLNMQLNDPVHVLKTENLANDWGALAFLLPKEEKPIFNNNNVEVTEAAAKIVGSMYFSLSKRKVDLAKAQRFVLQLVVALFAEDVDLIPKYTIHKILGEAVKNPVTQKELTSLFEAMSIESSSKKPIKYKGIAYFNGGIFNEVDAVELNYKEIDMLYEASKQDWSKVRPSIFGSIFEASMDPKERHGHGIHYTSELDIQKIVNPTIVRPFRERIEKAKSKKDLSEILKDIREFRVLDPACGSGNFLYISFRELRRLEVEVMGILSEKEKSKQTKMAMVSPKNFYGIDTNGFGLELAKVALSIGRKLSADEFKIPDYILPFENLDGNFLNKDALLIDWPRADAVIGNPPYLSSKFLKVEFPVDYVNCIRKKFKDVPGRADYCVYWFRKTHDFLEAGKRAGLVGTNTIRQNYSRVGGLDYIVQNGGAITEAVSTQVWSGDASVHVSIVNWIKGNPAVTKRLYTQIGDKVDSPWKVEELLVIPSALSSSLDVTQAKIIRCNRKPKKCFQGQSPASEGFYITAKQRGDLIREDSDSANVIFPFLIGREMLSKERLPKRFVIDFGQMNIIEAKKFRGAFRHIEDTVLVDVQKKARNEKNKSGEEGDWNAHLQMWWKHWRGRPELFAELKGKKRFISVSRVTKRPIFEFVSTMIHPGDALIAFAFDDDYSFGVIHSDFHWQWFKEKCSTLKGDFRYTADSVFDTFVWPQDPSKGQVEKVAEAAVELRTLRNKILIDNKWGLKDLYRTLDLPGKNPLKDAHSKLDEAVRVAYGMNKKDNPLKFLLDLNFQTAEKESKKLKVQGPGLPKCVKEPKSLITSDCIEPE